MMMLSNFGYRHNGNSNPLCYSHEQAAYPIGTTARESSDWASSRRDLLICTS